MNLTQCLKVGLVACGLMLPVAMATRTAAGIAPTSNAAPARVPAPPVPKLNWQPCTEPTQKGFQCATAQVPLDYQNPSGKSIQLAVIKRPASDQSRRIGSLFSNFGGPGGAGTVALPAFFSKFPTELSQRFDIISFDPRGINESTPVKCFDNADKEQSFYAKLPQGFPVGEAEIQKWIQGYTRLGQLCQQKNGKLLAHISTAEVAKDMDLLRRAVGAPMFNYIGLSYGTYLGAVYANLFPDKVRAMVLDGNADPIAWNNGGHEQASLSTSLRIGEDLGTAKTLKAFLDLCGQTSKDRCAFSAGSAAATQTNFAALLEKLRKQPVVIDGETYTYAALINILSSSSLYIVQKVPGFPGWSGAADLLQKAWEAPAATLPDPSTIHVVPPDFGFIVVTCAESPNPRDPEAFRQLAAFAFKRAGAVGPSVSWGDSACATWPATAADRYSGPWNRPTANPILVIGNTYDPATPYEGAVAMARELARARLLTVDGYGHTVFLNPSQCANQYITKYFINGQLPPKRTTCKQDYQPFSSSSDR